MKKLNEIINCNYTTLIKNIKTDSRDVEKGDLFVAVKGYNVDHSLYIKDAIKHHASAIITDKEINTKVPTIIVNDIESVLIDICKKFYDYNESINLIGITGTDGKTTTATMIKELLNNTAYIGTNGLSIKNKNITTSNTTPTIEKLYKYFDIINQNNIDNISMEISSEALLHKRVDSLKFKYEVFTNIHEDHLNIHKTKQNYINSKLKLVNMIKDDGIIIINNDDKNLEKIKLNKNINIITYGKKESNFQIKNISYDKYACFDIVHNNKIYRIKSPFIGEYNIYNLTAAFIILYLEKYDIKNTIQKIKKLKSIPGRGEDLDFGQNYKIILDYAHTENAIKSIIEEVKNKYKKIIVVTGQAGGREKEKRSKIGKYLLDNVDLVILTMDDPRYEKVRNIIDDMLKDTDKKNYKRIISRTKAIKYALDIAQEDEIVLILGKGRDNYMAIKNKKKYYCDYNEIKKYFKK